MIKYLLTKISHFSSVYFKIMNPVIFNSKRGKEYLQMYSESELKQVFFKLHSKIKGFKNVENYNDSKKKSNTVFILGSGESINELTENDWKEIRSNNIIGLNYSFVHPVIPDYHLMEMIPLKEMQDFFCEITDKHYKNVDVFFQYKHIIKSGFNLKKYKHQKNLYVHIPRLLPTTYTDILEKYFHKLFNKGNIMMKDLVHHNSHIGCAVMFAQALGYKNIVMLGIDLNNGDYFTDSDIQNDTYPHSAHYDRMNSLRKRHLSNVNEFKNKIHPTASKEIMSSRAGVTMQEYFEVYQKVFIKNSDSKLFVGSYKSTLAEILPVYPFECNK